MQCIEGVEHNSQKKRKKETELGTMALRILRLTCGILAYEPS
jgi:hypothetical protein